MGNEVKKLCFVIGSLERGGTETHLKRVLPLLDRRRFKPSIFCFVRKGELASALEEKGVKVFEPVLFSSLTKHSALFKPLLLVASIFSFISYLLRNKPDVVHFFLPASYLLLGPISLLHKKSKKLMSRRSLNVYQQKYPAFIRGIELWLHQRMHGVIGNSQQVVNELKADEGVPTNKLHLIYNGITVRESSLSQREQIRVSLNIPPDRLVMTIVANLIPYKGHLDLLNACGQLPTRDWILLIVGHDSSSIQGELEHLVEQNNLQDCVHFLGVRNDVTDIWASSDIGLLVSHEEGFSNAVLEGMAANLPMIVTSVGGNAEAVLDGETGLVVPPHSPEDLANAMKKLLKDNVLRHSMGKRAGQRVRQCFSMESCIEGYEALYNQLFLEN
ncbi:hypothetical protein WH95_10110 [Kiloniella litopenaei]|uniref:Glycosyl transferase family 1 domain-containing protein n=1 Tax=Kiloniella litopenaei TaxID=1549748 RepID=A0A0M2R5A5_9PROT|nr:hypothetical protein WH95_10110 [Kiloniella litopenaei]